LIMISGLLIYAVFPAKADGDPGDRHLHLQSKQLKMLCKPLKNGGVAAPFVVVFAGPRCPYLGGRQNRKTAKRPTRGVFLGWGGHAAIGTNSPLTGR